MKPAGLALLAALVLSVFAAASQAYALDPVTFTTKDTATSQNQQWQQVYETGQTSGQIVTALDASNSGTYYQVSYNNFALQFNGNSQYAQAASNSVYDVTTGDFWMFGLFYRTSDSGGYEAIAVKKNFTADINAGYAAYINPSDQLFVFVADGSNFVSLTSTTTISLNTWYAIGINVDRTGNLSYYLYNLTSGTLERKDASITSLSSTWTNTQMFTVGSRSDVAAAYLPARIDHLIPPQSGTLSQAEFLALAQSGTVPAGVSNIYYFNEGFGSTAYDSIGSNNLTLTGSPAYVTSVPNTSIASIRESSYTINTGGNAIDRFAFQGPVEQSRYSLLFASGNNERVSVGDNASLDFGAGTDFTILARVKSSYGSTQQVVFKGDFAAGQPYYALRIDADGRISGDVNDGTNDAVTTSAATVLNGQWHSIGMVVDRNGSMQLYVDGAASGSPVSMAAVGNIDNARALNIGARYNGGAYQLFMEGRIDDVMIFNSALSGSTIAGIHSDTLATANMVSWWDMNEGIGTNLDDRGGSNDGTMTGASGVPDWSVDIAPASFTRLTNFITGYATNTGNQGILKMSIADNAIIESNFAPTGYAPRGITASTSKIYTPMYEFAPANGKLYLTSILREGMTGGTTTTLYTGDSSVPAHAKMYEVTNTSNSAAMTSAVNAKFAERVDTGSALIGKTINRISVVLAKNMSPTGTMTVGIMDSSGSFVETYGTLDISTLTGTPTTYYFGGRDHILAAGDRIGVSCTGCSVDGSNFPVLYYSNDSGVSNANIQQFSSGSWNNVSVTFDVAGLWTVSNVKSVVYEGSPDKLYTFFESGTNALRVVKYDGSATLLGTAMTHTAGQPFQVVQMTDKILIQTSSAVYQLLTATDAISQVYGNTFQTRYPQTFNLTPTARTFNSAPVYVASTAVAYNHTPSTSAVAQVSVMIEATNNSTGLLDAYGDNDYYFLSQNDLVVEGPAPTWTIKDPGTRFDESLTTYQENLGINLTLDSSIPSQNVIRLVCGTGSYNATIAKFSVGSDSDCSYWKIQDTDDDPIARRLPFARTKELVHADAYTNYNVHITAFEAGPFSATIRYNAKDVDYNTFDSGNNAQVRLLYGQCYDILFKNVLSGETVQTQTLCADDVISKEAILSKTLGFNFWLNPWAAYHNYNSTSGILTTVVRHNIIPYDYNIRIYDNDDTLVVNATHTAPQEIDPQVYNVTSYLPDKPLLLKIYNDEAHLIYTVYLDDRPRYLASIGEQFQNWNLAGWNILYFLPLVFIGISTRNTAGVAGGIAGAAIAALNWLGIFPGPGIPEPVMWGIVMVGVVGFFAYRRLHE